MQLPSYINTYVPDIITTDGRPVADKKRIGELQELIYAFVDEADGSDYFKSNASSMFVCQGGNPVQRIENIT